MRTTKKQIKKPTNLRYGGRTPYGILILFFLLCATFGVAQELRVIDNKGTIRTVTSNNVTTATTAPTSPVEGDVWFDTTTNNSKIYDGSSWLIIDDDAVTVSTTTPTTPVQGDVWFDTTNDITKIYDGSAWQEIKAVSARSLWDKDDNTGIQVEESNDENKIRFDTNGNERMIIDDSGNVGINRTNPTEKLTISTGADTDAPGILLHRSSANDPAGIYMSYGTNAKTVGIQADRNMGGTNNGGIQFIASNNRPIQFYTKMSAAGSSLYNVQEAGRFLGNGNFGLGTNNPSDKLHVSGNARITGTLKDSNNEAGTSGQILSSTATGTDWIDVATPTALWDADTNTGVQVEESTNEDKIRFDTGGTERMIIDDSGNLGVGESSPTDKLHVSGDARITGALKDSNNEAGTSGQILSSTATGTDWIDPAAAYLGSTTHVSSATTLADANSTTKVHIEPSGSLTVDGSVLSDGFSTLVINHSGASSTVNFSGFAGAFELNEFKSDITADNDFDIAYLESAILTVTENGGNKYLNISRFDGGIDSVIEDADGNTKIQMEETANEDKIRFDTGGTERLILDDSGRLLFANPGDFANSLPPNLGGSSSAVLGIDGTTQGRLRLTSGSSDSRNDTEGASIDLHANSASANTGVLDLVAGQAASGTNAAIKFWTNSTGASGGQATRMVVTGNGNVGIGNTAPNANAILDLTNSDDKALLLPSETLPTNISSPTDGMLVYSTNNNNAYVRADSAWKPIAYNAVSNEQIFDGDDDADTSNDDYYYVSMVINGSWKVIRYNKTDMNDEKEATETNNSGQTTQPTDLATCTGLTFS